MAERQITIINKLGLHARAAAKFVTLAGRFQSEILIGRNGQRVNAKSIMGIMMLAAAKGSQLQLSATGPDAEDALDALETLVRERFGEAE